MSQNREALRAAIAALERAEIDLAKSVEALERSRLMQSSADEELAGFGDLDAQIVEHHSATLRAAIASGEVAPDFAIPKNLADLRAKRAVAIEKAEAIRAVVDELAGDRECVEKAVDRCRYELDLAVEKVVAEEAKTIAEAFLADFRNLLARQRQLGAFLERRVRLDPDQPRPSYDPMGGYRQMQFPQVVHEAMRCGLAGHEGPELAERIAAEPRASVAAFIQSLRTNPEAKFL